MENKNPNQQKLNTRFLQSFQKNVLKIFQKTAMVTKLGKVLVKLLIQWSVCQTTKLAYNGGTFQLKTFRCTVMLKLPVVMVDVLLQSDAAHHTINIRIHGLKKTSTCKNHWDLKPINYKINFNQYPKKSKNKKKIKY